MKGPKKPAASRPEEDYYQIEVVERLTNLYGSPSRDNLRAFLQEYREAFEKVERTLLREAVSKAIKLHDFSAGVWPSIGLIQRQITEVGQWRASQRAREEALRRSPWDAPRDPPEVRARVRRMAEETLAKLRAEGETMLTGQDLPPWAPADAAAWEGRRFDLIWEGRTVNSPTFHRVGGNPIGGHGE